MIESPPPGQFSLWQLLFYPLFSSVGGFLGYVLRQMDAGNKVSMIRALFESAGAGFVGVLVMLICQALGLGAQWTGVIVGVCGWLGATASIRMLEKIAWRKLGVSDTGGTTDGKP